jgi:CDP-paratose 2-epimerase
MTLGRTGGRKSGTGSRPALITGGAGFIGTNLADRLLRQGRPVIVYDSLARPGSERNLRWLRATHGTRLRVEIADMRATSRLRDAVAEAGTVFHLASQVAVTTSLDDPAGDFAVNAAATLDLLEMLRRRGDARGGVGGLIFTSTNKVYGAIDDIDLVARTSRYVPAGPLADAGVAETRPLQFHSPYGCSKGAADQYVLDYARSYGLATCVLRMSCVYGPHQNGTEDQGWVAHFLIRAIQGRKITIYGNGKQVRDLLFVDDLVRALTLAELHLPEIAGRAFNIGGGLDNTVSLLELTERIAALHGESPKVEFGDWRVGDQRWYVSDNTEFSRITGWRPQVGVTEGIRLLYDWLLADWRGAALLQAAQ